MTNKNTLYRTTLLLILSILLVSTLATRPGSAATPAAGVVIIPGKTSKSGIPGSIVSYGFDVTNTDATDIDLRFSATSLSGWADAIISPDPLTLPAASTARVSVSVPVPVSATTGQNDITTVSVLDAGNAVLGTLQLTTTVSAPPAAGRPLLMITSYDQGTSALYGGSEFDLGVGIKNNGTAKAHNIVITFSGSEIYPRNTGGVISLAGLNAGESTYVVQRFLLGDSLAWSPVASIQATITYTDANGVSYSEPFNLTITITTPNYTAPTPTPTAGALMNPQLVIGSYSTDIDPLQPGLVFKLNMDITNLGMADARAVSMVIGGGVTPGDGSGTPSPGGMPGSAGDLTNFAPLGSSNIVYLGDIVKGSTLAASQELIVNVNTAPGAYPLKISFVYNDAKGNRIVDDQVITLLVFSLPQLEISFYRDPGMLMAGMENILPIQVINLGKKTAVLGNMKVTASNADTYNNISLVGSLEPGGYYTLDVSLLPFQEGPLDISVVISYTDDFNQLRSFEQLIPVEIQPAMDFEPIPGEGEGEPGWEEPVEVKETFWTVLWRIIKGLLGLDSGKQTPSLEPEMPFYEEVVPNGEMKGW